MFFGNTRITPQDFDKSGTVVAGAKTLYYNPSITETNRPGIVNKLTYTVGDHKLIGGYWFEFANHRQTAPYAALNADGTIADPYLTSNAYVITSGPYAGQVMQRRDQTTRTTTNMLFVGDTWSINNRWTMEMGVKQAFIKRHVTNALPGATPVVDYSDQATLPQLGLRYKIDDKHQLFSSIGTSFRSTPNYTLADSYSNSSGSRTPWQAAPTEKSITAEVGHRYQGETFATSVSLFGTRYSNRQITTTVLDPTNPLGTTTTSLTMNVGSVNIVGLDAEFGTRRMFGGWRAYTSGELLNTNVIDNLPVNVSSTVKDYLPTSGKSLPRAPNHMIAFGIDYDDDHLFGNLTYKWIGSQYSTLMNDQKIGGYGRLDAGIGYRFDKIGFANQPEFRINLYNVLNAKSLTGVAGVQNNAVATTGLNGATIAASGTPTYYAGQGFAAIGSFKVGF
jgi:iron complex outermembrane receptor protein